MQELLSHVITYAIGVWRFRWYMMAIAWVICIVGWVMVFRMPDQWDVQARVYVETQSMLRNVMQGLAVSNPVEERIRLMTQKMLSRPNLEKVARMTDMDLKVRDPREMEELVTALGSQISISGASRQNIFTISYQSHDPQLAKRVVQALLNIFVEDTLGANRKDTDIAQQFLETQIREYESRLVNAEDRLKEFKRKHVGMMPGQGGGYYQRMESSENALKQVQLELREAEIRRDEIQRQMEGYEPVVLLPEEPVIEEEPVLPADAPSPTPLIDQRLAALAQQLDGLLLRYTEKHPDVVAMKDQMESLEAQRKEKVKAHLQAQAKREQRVMPSAPGAEDFGFGGGPSDPVMMEMKVALAQAEAEVASLTVRSDEYKRRVNELGEMVDTLPQVEAELAKLNRNYDVNKRKYESLLERYETARISNEADQSADDVKFRIIDPPRVPLVPSGPNRPLFLVVVLVGGLGAGVAMALVLSVIRPIFDSRFSLTNATGLPVLGTVTMVWTPGQQWRRRVSMVTFVVSGFALVSVFGGVMVLEIVGLESLYKLPGVSRFL
ncbi:MAG: XrtA system polysaccharide chain length determinant [Gammaproteobacteria bacterium]